MTYSIVALLLMVVLSYLVRNSESFKHNVVRLKSRPLGAVDAEEFVNNFQEWISTESLVTLLPKEDTYVIIEELQKNKEFWDRGEIQFKKIWSEYETKGRSETRKLSAILGESTTQKLLTSVEKLDIYDPQTVTGTENFVHKSLVA